MTHREARQVIQKHKDIRERYKELKPEEKSKSSVVRVGDSQFELNLGFGE